MAATLLAAVKEAWLAAAPLVALASGGVHTNRVREGTSPPYGVVEHDGEGTLHRTERKVHETTRLRLHCYAETQEAADLMAAAAKNAFDVFTPAVTGATFTACRRWKYTLEDTKERSPSGEYMARGTLEYTVELNRVLPTAP